MKAKYKKSSSIITKRLQFPTNKERMLKKNSAIKLLKDLLKKVIEILEIRRLLDESNGKNAPDMLIDFIERLNNDKTKQKYDEYT